MLNSVSQIFTTGRRTGRRSDAVSLHVQFHATIALSRCRLSLRVCVPTPHPGVGLRLLPAAITRTWQGLINPEMSGAVVPLPPQKKPRVLKASQFLDGRHYSTFRQSMFTKLIQRS